MFPLVWVPTRCPPAPIFLNSRYFPLPPIFPDSRCLTGHRVLPLQAICTEAGLLALRERRMKVMSEDFRKAKENVLYRKNEGTPEGLYL